MQKSHPGREPTCTNYVNELWHEQLLVLRPPRERETDGVCASFAGATEVRVGDVQTEAVYAREPGAGRLQNTIVAERFARHTQNKTCAALARSAASWPREIRSRMRGYVSDQDNPAISSSPGVERIWARLSWLKSSWREGSLRQPLLGYTA
jgi:hypothetical protein